jgi:hypothetical protein
MSASARRGTIRTVPILLLLAAAVILVGVVSVAMGHGGEMAEFATDYVPPDLVTAADVVLLRPPSAFWGYNVQVTDEALNRAAQVITERDVEIAVLRQQLAELRSATGSHAAIAATLLARSKAASARGSSTRQPSTTQTGTRGTSAGQAGSPDRAAPAAGPLDLPSPEQETPGGAMPGGEGPGGEGPHDSAGGTVFPGSDAASPGLGAPRSGEAAAGRDD